MPLEVGGLEGGEEVPHIAPRREHNSFAPVRQNALHCYGVDFLSNKEVLEVFSSFGPESVEWLDDSSCNVIFKGEDAPPRVLQKLASAALGEDAPPQPEHWTVTKPLTVGKADGKQRGGKAPRQRQFCLELRMATEADRKDPGHSGHTDSVYYAHVKEQQALQKQQEEDRRTRKRQRHNRLPSASQEELAAAADAVEAAMGGAAMGGPEPPEAAEEKKPALPKLGMKGLLDPLLFLRAGGNSQGGTAPADEAAGADQSQRKSEDLLSALRRAEAEYAAVVQPEILANSAAAPAEADRGRQRRRPMSVPQRQAATDRGRKRTPGGNAGRDGTPGPRRKTPGRPDGRERTPPPRPLKGGQQQARGKKRRPVEQEPRPVSGAAPAARAVAAIPEVEAFLAEHKVKCQRFRLKSTFRGIKYGQQKKPKEAKAEKPEAPATEAGADAAPAKMDDGASEAAPAADAGQEAAAAPAAEATPADGQASDQPAKMDEDSAASGAKPGKKGKEQQRGKGKGGGKGKKDGPELPPWEQYMQVNKHFVQHGHFFHTVAWEVEGRVVLTVVPHPSRVDQERLARAVQQPRSKIRQRKLADISKQTGWPVFVCPPFGHPKDTEGRGPMLLVDSTAMELRKPLLFDCGSVGLSIPVSEFFRSTGASCVEGLARPEQPQKALPPDAAAPAAGTDAAMQATPDSSETAGEPPQAMEA